MHVCRCGASAVDIVASVSVVRRPTESEMGPFVRSGLTCKVCGRMCVRSGLAFQKCGQVRARPGFTLTEKCGAMVEDKLHIKEEERGCSWKDISGGAYAGKVKKHVWGWVWDSLSSTFPLP